MIRPRSLLGLLVALSYGQSAVSAAAGEPKPFPVTEPRSSPTDDLNGACLQLLDHIPEMLSSGATTSGESLNLTYPFARYYPEGSNPTTAELFLDVDAAGLRPTDDILGSIDSIGDWTREQIIADLGYGEQTTTQSIIGGLPAFCRFGGFIVTSNMSNVFFETWLPLPSIDDPDSFADPASLLQAQISFNTTYNQLNADWANTTEEAAVDSRRRRRQEPAPAPPATTPAPSAPASDPAAPPPPPSTPAASSPAPTIPVPPPPGPYKRAPRSGWRGRLLGLGNAAQKGSVPYPDLKQAMTRYREAVTGTNGGHFGTGGATVWSAGNLESQIDFAHRAVHVTTVASQTITKFFYGVADRRVDNGDGGSSKRPGFASIFAGCSTGGRQAFAEVQRYPNDFDGVLAGSPAIDYSNLSAYQIYVNSLLANKTDPGFFNKTMYPLIHQAVLNQCDALDGVIDNVIGNPQGCKPDFAAALLCGAGGGTNASTCMTQPQLDKLATIYQPYIVNGTLIHEPVMYGSEFAWTVTDGVVGKPFPAAPGWYQYGVQNLTGERVANGDVASIITAAALPNLIDMANTNDPSGTNTWNTDISDYINRNSKIIHTHGWADQLIPPGSSVRYFEEVRRDTDPKIEGSLRNNYRLFMVCTGVETIVGQVTYYSSQIKAPGMAHCRLGGSMNFGGPGQTDEPGWRPFKYDADHNALLALFRWVDEDIAPDSLIAAQYNTATGVLSDAIPKSSDVGSYGAGVRNLRRLCPYPEVSIYLGPRPFAAESFHCVDPRYTKHDFIPGTQSNGTALPPDPAPPLPLPVTSLALPSAPPLPPSSTIPVQPSANPPTQPATGAPVPPPTSPVVPSSPPASSVPAAATTAPTSAASSSAPQSVVPPGSDLPAPVSEPAAPAPTRRRLDWAR